MTTPRTNFAISQPKEGVLNKLVDSSKPNTVLYSILQHEHFGMMIGAFVVEHTVSGSLSLRHQRLLPENIQQFAHIIDDTDRELTELLNEINTQQLYKHFGVGIPKLEAFLKKFTVAPFKDYVTDYVQAHLLKALPLLTGKPLYRVGKDGYPAWRPVEMVSAQAEIAFNFRREATHTSYVAEVSLAGQRLNLATNNKKLPEKSVELRDGVLVDEPAWLLYGQQLFTFNEPVDGKKLQPFFKQEIIIIPRERERAYFEKFLVRLIEQHEVTAEGFNITEVAEKPEFAVRIGRDKDSRYAFRLIATYAGIEVVPGEGRKASVRMEEKEDELSFVKMVRNPAMEQQQLALFKSISPEHTLFDFMLPEQEAHHWLLDHEAGLIEAGILIRHDYPKPHLSTDELTLELALKQTESGYELQFKALSGTEEITFRLLRTAIMQENRTIRLTDEKLVILPEAWLSDYRHLMEVGTPQANGLILATHQLSLLPETLQPTQGDGAAHLADFEQIERQPLPDGLKAELRDYQQAGFEWLCFLNKYELGGLLADDMGLGKTIQTLTLLQREKNRLAGGPHTTSLIVVPNSLIFNWINEAEKFAPDLNFMIYGGAKKNRSARGFFPYDVLITTYGMVRQDIAKFTRLEFHYIILDESQLIKNRDAKTTQAVFKLRGKHRLSLTGTPIENSTLDLWAQMQFLNPGLLGSERFFETYYAEPIERNHDATRALRLRELIKPFILRRTKSQVASELPPMVEQIQYCEMLPEQFALYEANRQHYKHQLFGGPDGKPVEHNKIQILSSLQRLRQIAIHPQMIEEGAHDSGKYEAMWGLLQGIIAQKSKVIIFSQFVKFLTILKADMLAQGIPFSYLDGSTDDRQGAVDRFQQDPDTRVFLISLKAGGVGLNLTAAEYVLMLDPWWNPAVERQAMNRAHRIGQSKTVFAYKFITKGSIEEKILLLQAHKERIAGEVIQTEEQFFKLLSPADLKALFE